jgi:hypothetical protein
LSSGSEKALKVWCGVQPNRRSIVKL